MSISIRRITCREAWENPSWSKIVKEYGEDVKYPDLEPDPDYESYLWLEIKGTLHSVGAFDGDRLVGFVNYVTTKIPHFKGKTLASSESLWVDLDYRKTGVGRELIEAAERFAKEDGCYGIYWGVKKGTRAEKLFEKIATPMNVLFWKKL